MAFRIERTEEVIEVHLWGQGRESEILAILGELYKMAPRKEVSDLWLVSEDYVVPWDAFSTIAKQVRGFLSHDMVAKNSAIVVANQFQMVQAELYRNEAQGLPFEIGVFLTREDAVAWLKK